MKQEEQYLYSPGLDLVLAGSEEIHQLQTLVASSNDLTEATEITKYRKGCKTLDRKSHINFI